MKARSRPYNAFACLLALALMAGCASTKESNYQQLVSGPLPRPNQIWVYAFAASPADVPPNSALAGQSSFAAPETPDRLAQGLKLGAEIAGQLVQEINAMGMPASGLHELASADSNARGAETPVRDSGSPPCWRRITRPDSSSVPG